MSNDTDTELKRLLLADIEADMRQERKLRGELAELQTRTERAKEYFRLRFGQVIPGGRPAERSLAGGIGGTLRTRASGPSHAQLAAVALTEADKVSAPLKIAQIHRYLVRAGMGSMTHPTRQTLISSVMRSPLFQKVGRGLYALVGGVGRENLSMSSGTGAAGAKAGNEEAEPRASGTTQGSEAAPTSPTDV